MLIIKQEFFVDKFEPCNNLKILPLNSKSKMKKFFGKKKKSFMLTLNVENFNKNIYIIITFASEGKLKTGKRKVFRALSSCFFLKVLCVNL